VHRVPLCRRGDVGHPHQVQKVRVLDLVEVKRG